MSFESLGEWDRYENTNIPRYSWLRNGFGVLLDCLNRKCHSILGITHHPKNLVAVWDMAVAKKYRFRIVPNGGQQGARTRYILSFGSSWVNQCCEIVDVFLSDDSGIFHYIRWVVVIADDNRRLAQFKFWLQIAGTVSSTNGIHGWSCLFYTSSLKSKARLSLGSVNGRYCILLLAWVSWTNLTRNCLIV